MDAPDHSLPSFDAETLKRARRWLILAVIALGAGGIYAGFIGGSASRFFDTALTEHVDLSVLIWFMAMSCMFFTLVAGQKGWPMLADAGFLSTAIGTLLIAAAPITGAPVFKSDYVPVLYHPVFFMGLALIFCGTLSVAANLSAAGRMQTSSIPAYGVVSAAWIMIIAAACFLRSGQSLPAEMKGQIYYEYLFWGGGHVLQFVHSQLVIVAWLWLARSAGLKVRLSAAWTVGLYFIGLLATMTAAIIYVAYDPMSDEFRNAFTALMRDMNGLAPMIAGLFIAAAFFAAPREMRASWPLPLICLAMSILLFGLGGSLGYMIEGSNVIVPAHYHGSIVGITLAYMGVAYLLMPAFGYETVLKSKLARVQPVIYGGGQLCWMLGMAILGAHGVPRKTAGSADTLGALASFIKHSGDGLALIGGLLFVFVVLRAVFHSRRHSAKAGIFNRNGIVKIPAFAGNDKRGRECKRKSRK